MTAAGLAPWRWAVVAGTVAALGLPVAFRWPVEGARPEVVEGLIATSLLVPPLVAGWVARVLGRRARGTAVGTAPANGDAARAVMPWNPLLLGALALGIAQVQGVQAFIELTTHRHFARTPAFGGQLSAWSLGLVRWGENGPLKPFLLPGLVLSNLALLAIASGWPRVRGWRRIVAVLAWLACVGLGVIWLERAMWVVLDR